MTAMMTEASSDLHLPRGEFALNPVHSHPELTANGAGLTCELARAALRVQLRIHSGTKIRPQRMIRDREQSERRAGDQSQGRTQAQSRWSHGQGQNWIKIRVKVWMHTQSCDSI